jgi:hypothetical protein
MKQRKNHMSDYPTNRELMRFVKLLPKRTPGVRGREGAGW